MILLGGCGDGEKDPKPPPPVVSERAPPPTLAEMASGSSSPPAAELDPDDWVLPDPQGEPATSPWLRLLYSQDNRAEVEACGCPGSPTGGLARRAEYVRRVRAVFPEILVLEGPTALSRAVLGFETLTGKDRARGRVVLEALAASAPAAFFPGQADFAVFEPGELAALAHKHQLRLVVTNLGASPSEESYERFYRWEEHGQSILFLGLVGSAGTEERSRLLPLEDAAEAARRVVAEVTEASGKPDLVVAFTDGDLRDVGAWRSAGLDLDLLLTGPVPGDSRVHHGDSKWLSVRSDPLGRAFRRLDLVLGEPGSGVVVVDRGFVERVAVLEEQYLHRLGQYWALQGTEEVGRDPRRSELGMDGVVRVDPRTDPVHVRRGLAEVKQLRRRSLERLPAGGPHRVGVGTWVIEPSVTEDPRIVALLDGFGTRRLAALRVELGEVEQVPADERYAGRRGCTECHAPLDAHWTRSPHAKAWKALVDRGEEDNPECLPCHTTGFGLPGGFVDPVADRSLLNVQCEACHGPMRLHAQQSVKSRVRPDPGLRVTEATCRRCHDEANSPRFDFRSYSSRVRHPGVAAP